MSATSALLRLRLRPKPVIGFFFLIVFDFGILDGNFLIAFDHGHARRSFSFFFLGGFVLIFAGGGDDQGRFHDHRGFFVFLLGLGLAVFVLVLGLFFLGLLGADYGLGHGGPTMRRFGRCL